LQKPEGSLAKWAGRSGTLRSGPSDPDLMARIKGGAVLISAVHPISGGQGGSGAWGRRGSPELPIPRRRGSARGAPTGASRGSGGLRSRRRRGICRGDGAHLGRVRVENPERPRSNGTRRAAGDDPGSTKGSCGGRWRLGGRSGAGPRRSRGATGQSGVEAAALGFVGRRLRMGEQGGAARATYRAAAALACVPAVGKRRDPRREFGRQLRGGGEEPATGATASAALRRGARASRARGGGRPRGGPCGAGPSGRRSGPC